MPQVRVWNDNKFDHKEIFKGEPVSIPAGEFVTMDFEDAIGFKGQYYPMVLDADGNPTAQGYKMIRIEHIDPSKPAPTPKVDPMKCVACAYQASSDKDLSEHAKTHAEQLVSDPLAEAELKSQGKKKAG